jgi:hypothetical protein
LPQRLVKILNDSGFDWRFLGTEPSTLVDGAGKTWDRYPFKGDDGQHVNIFTGDRPARNKDMEPLAHLHATSEVGLVAICNSRQLLAGASTKRYGPYIMGLGYKSDWVMGWTEHGDPRWSSPGEPPWNAKESARILSCFHGHGHFQAGVVIETMVLGNHSRGSTSEIASLIGPGRYVSSPNSHKKAGKEGVAQSVWSIHEADAKPSALIVLRNWSWFI